MTTFAWQQSPISLIRVKYQVCFKSLNKRWECLHWSHISMMTKELITDVSKPGLWSCSRARICIHLQVSVDQHLKPCVQIPWMNEKKTEVWLILTESLCQHIQLLQPRVSWSTSRMLTRPRKATNDQVCGHGCWTPQGLAAFPYIVCWKRWVKPEDVRLDRPRLGLLAPLMLLLAYHGS